MLISHRAWTSSFRPGAPSCDGKGQGGFGSAKTDHQESLSGTS